ncbi:cytochrome P450 [Streptomyces globisporus]|uniref:Cytochrome P450 n=1 Tax=Streptomyces globisporus TaxID=1908 RepID=A0A423V4W9_STRGL|nr:MULTISPECIES: cytochrome P450 [Streptomyces]ROV69651.1 cytochrome P450 [Streptomyces globisporus]
MTSVDHGTVSRIADLPVAERRDEAWRRLSAQGEVVPMADGLALTSLAVVKAVLREPNRFSIKKVFDAVETGYPLIPLAFDPPEQTNYRRILLPFFSPRRIRPLEESLRAQAIDLIEAVKGRGSCDFVADIAGPFPAQSLLTLLGLPLDDRDRFIGWKDAALELTADAAGELPLTTEERAAKVEQTMAMGGYLTELIRTRRSSPDDDILSEILAIEGDDRLSDDEALGVCLMLVLAGLETVTDALSLGMERLAASPERSQELVDDPSLVPAAVEELLRLDAPAPFLPRITTEDVEIGGCPVPAGTLVNAHLNTANRDEACWPHAYEIDFHRQENPHTSFGLGAHRCLGTHLARLEMRIVLEEWHRRIPRYAIAEGTAHRAKLVRANLGLESLRLSFG